MRRQLLVNGSLLALALVTLGAVWLTRESPTSSQKSARQSKLLPSWNKAAVERIRLQRPGAELELVREAGESGDFRIVKPWPERADIATVNALLGSLELATPLRGASASLEQAGLAAPTLRISVEMSGKLHTLALGAAAPAPAGARYASVTLEGGSSRLYTVSQGVVSELDLPFDKFRETRLVDYAKSELARIELSSARGKSTLVSGDRGVFLLQTSSGRELCDRERSEAILTALSRLSTEQFVDPERARAALSDDALKLVLEPKADAARPVELRFGAATAGQELCPGVPERSLVLREQAGLPAKAGCVAAEVSAPLWVEPAQLQADTVTSARPDELEELQIQEGSARLDLARKDRAFLLRAPSVGPLALDAGNQRLAAIMTTRGKRMSAAAPGALGLDPPAGQLTLRISGEPDARVERLSLGKPQADGGACLKRELDAVALCFDAQAARAFRADATLLKSLELLAVAPSELDAFSLETLDLRQRVVRGADGGYQLEQPAGFRHDGGLVADAVQTLGSLRAERWVAAGDDGSYGLAAPRLRAKLELSKGEPKTRELLVGAATNGGYFATLSPDPGVFVLARSVLSELEVPLLERSLCPVVESELSRIELARDGRRLTLSRSDDGWSADAAAPERARGLAEASTGLRAERALHLGAAAPAEGFGRPSLTLDFVDRQGKRQRLLFGARTERDGEALAFARLDSVAATFVVALDTLRALQDF